MSGKTKSPYETLGVSQTASAKEIQSAYRTLARKYHPDVNPDNPDAEEKFKEINAAYAVLSDPEKRRDFDHGAINANGDPIYSNDNYGRWHVDNPFDHMNGFRFFFNQPQVTNQNVTVYYEIDASKLFEQHDVLIKYKRVSACSNCTGGGGTGNHKVCDGCNGTGNKVEARMIGGMKIQEHVQCRICKGRGQIFDANCQFCDGIGLKTTNEEINITMPANCAYGNIVVDELGHQEILTVPPGDLVIVVIPKSQYCKFDGYTANYELLVDPIRAILGCKVKAKGLKPKEELLIDIPKMTEHNTRIVLKQKGLCDMKGKRHDANIIVVYKMPENLSEEQEAALNAYLASTNSNAAEKQTK